MFEFVMNQPNQPALRNHGNIYYYYFFIIIIIIIIIIMIIIIFRHLEKLSVAKILKNKKLCP